MSIDGYITDRDLVAARALLRWSAKDLCGKSGVGVATIRRFETGGAISDDRKDKMVATLVKAGIVFLGPVEVDGVALARGVAMRPGARPKPQKKLTYVRGGVEVGIKTKAKPKAEAKPKPVKT